MTRNQTLLLILLLIVVMYLVFAYNRCKWLRTFGIGRPCPPLGESLVDMMWGGALQNSYTSCLSYHKALPDNTPCESCRTTTGGVILPVFKGVIKNGVCVEVSEQSIPRPVIVTTPQPPIVTPVTVTPSATLASKNLTVINPSGAVMYYRQVSPASGGYIYSPSNIVIPYGTKFALVNTYYITNNDPTKGWYETDYKQYGPTSGFFEIKDMQKS